MRRAGGRKARRKVRWRLGAMALSLSWPSPDLSPTEWIFFTEYWIELNRLLGEYFAQNIEFNIWLESKSLEHPAGVNGVKRGSRGKEGKWVVWEVLLLPRGYLLPFYLPLPPSSASWGASPTLPPCWSSPPPHLHLLAAFRVTQMIVWSASKYLLWFF